MQRRVHANRIVLLASFVFLVLGIAGSAPAQDDQGKVIPLSKADKETLEKYLGKGVIGNPIPAPPIDDAAAYYGLRKGTWHGTRATRSSDADARRYTMAPAEGDSVAGWRGSYDKTVRHIQHTESGDVQMTVEEDRDQEVLTRFDPPQPMVIQGMNPGKSKKVDIGVKVYDIDDPDDLEHQGTLTLTFTYIGAYQVHTPSGTHDAALFKWHFKGKIGPAKVEDTIYRAFAKDVGPVAFIETKNITAMLVYSDKSKVGFVLDKVTEQIERWLVMAVMDEQAASGDPVYGLVCAGGGAHGAYQVGVLKYVHEHFCVGAASPFRVFAGTSAGSLNTAFGAARSFDALTSRLRLEELWLGFHVPEYHGSMVKGSIQALLSDLKKPRGEKKSAWSLLDPAPIQDVVKMGFVREELDRAVREGTTLGLAVSATEIGSSRLVWFQEGPAAASWNTPGSIAIETRLDVPHIQASCSVPFAFPPVRIGEHFYLDGGVANRRPFTPAINMGATRILSIATDQPLPDDLPEYPPDFKPNVGATARMLLEQMSHDAATDDAANIEILNYFCEQNQSREHESVIRHILQGRGVHLESYRPTEIMLFAPSRRIRDSHVFKHELFDDALKDEQTVLRFHRDFTRPLIDFGYEDARARHPELGDFFDRERPQRRSRFAAAAL